MDSSVRALFHELAGRDSAERCRAYDSRGIGPEVRAEVESLIEHDAPESSLLTGCLENAVRDASAAPTVCGPYRLLRAIGAGGMGDVFLGERCDGEVRQRVAVKVLRMAESSGEWRAYFLRERQLLADLNHPSIAKLLDAGHTPGGTPYLVMEYVDGVAIDDWAATRPLAEKLRAFLQACAAVSHAHRHLVIHRDIKPSNILVDGSGQVKLLDFGIARPADGEVTLSIDRFLTPGYASPEQISGGPQTTATDVYSLGAVLWRLLSGLPPSGHGNSEAARTAIPGDLKLIIGKALRKEAPERYASVDALIADIEAFLGNRPVDARRGNAVYRFRKFATRHWIPSLAALAAIIAASTGFLAVNHERHRAQRRFNEVRQLSGKLFDIDRQIRNLPGATAARQLIVETSLDYLRRLEGDAAGDISLLLDLGTAYMRVARVQGVPITPNLGRSSAAGENLRVAERLIGMVLAERPNDRIANLRAAQIAHDRMILAQARHPDPEALALGRASRDLLGKYLDSGQIDEAEKEQVVIIGINVAGWFAREEQLPEALALLRRTIDIASKTGQTVQVAAAHINLARTLRAAGDLDAAQAAARRAGNLLRPPPGQKNKWATSYGMALATEGEILGDERGVSLGRRAEAIRLLDMSYSMARDGLRVDPGDAIVRVAAAARAIRLAGVLLETNPARSLGLYGEARRMLAELRDNPKARRDEVRALAGSAEALRLMSRAPEARQDLDEAFRLLRELKLYPAQVYSLTSEAASAIRAQAELHIALGNPRAAVEAYRQLLEPAVRAKTVGLEAAVAASALYMGMARAQRAAGDAAGAAATAALHVELWEKQDRRLPGNAFVQKHLAEARN